jgi:hypothetical protein
VPRVALERIRSLNRDVGWGGSCHRVG